MLLLISRRALLAAIYQYGRLCIIFHCLNHAVGILSHIEGANCATLSDEFVRRLIESNQTIHDERFVIGLEAVCQARSVVEHCLKSKLIMTGYIFDIYQPFDFIIIGLCN